ncbi:hypothetical protein KSS87_008650 [Heliosperma pusillum]|nr:hypothetical protein KSS87_008650 [Heliosperma pusillum]
MQSTSIIRWYTATLSTAFLTFRKLSTFTLLPSPMKPYAAPPQSSPLSISSSAAAAAAQPLDSPSSVTESPANSLVVVSFYKFADFNDHADFRSPLKHLCQHLIVSLGMPSVLPTERVGTYVSPKEWNTLINDPNTVVIDVRNGYETRIGKFKGAVDPCTTAFREFPSWVENNHELSGSDSLPSQEVLDNRRNESQGNSSVSKSPPRVAMYCTGGIRCEKASSYLLSKGFKEVYHLQGGILKYLEEVPESESLWEGECFVFDKRVSVEHGLAQGTYKLCYGCKQPVSDADMESPLYEYAVSCPYCFSTKSEEEKERARARQRQFENWGVIGGPHKGRRPTQDSDGTQSNTSQMSKSV